MNIWMLAAVVLTVALLACLAVTLTASLEAALVAIEVAAVLVTSTLMLLSLATHRQPFIDLALTFAFVSLVGSLAFARMMEQGE